jgi:hypothetical protein
VKRKENCTPEEWLEQLAKDRERKAKPHNLARAKAQRQTEEAKVKARARDKARYDTPKRREHAVNRYQTQEQKDKRREYRRNYYNNPERKARLKDATIQKLYGLTTARVRMLALSQGDRCAVCHAPFAPLFGPVATKSMKPHIDHCHATNKVRGLLCARCNVIEGLLNKMDISIADFAQRLQAYLDNPPAQEEQLW